MEDEELVVASEEHPEVVTVHRLIDVDTTSLQPTRKVHARNTVSLPFRKKNVHAADVIRGSGDYGGWLEGAGVCDALVGGVEDDG